MRMRRTAVLFVVLSCLAGFPMMGATDDDMGCHLDPGGVGMNVASFTIPVGTIVSAATAIGAIVTGGFSAVVSAPALIILGEAALIPDIEVVYGLEYSGRVHVVGCPKEVCAGGGLCLNATLLLEGQEPMVLATIPPSMALFKEDYPVLTNTRDWLGETRWSTVAGIGDDQDLREHSMEVWWELSISTLSINLVPPIGVGVLKIPMEVSGLSAHGTIFGDVVANLSCGRADHPIRLVGCPTDVTVPVDGFTEFTVRAEDADYATLDAWPEDERPSFIVKDFSDDRIIGQVTHDPNVPNAATIRIDTRSSVSDLVGRLARCTVWVEDSLGVHDFGNINLHFVEDHAPIAKRMESDPVTTEEFWSNGCEVTMEMAARDPDFPDNFSYDIWFAAAGTPNAGSWEAAQATTYVAIPNPGAGIDIPGVIIVEPSYTTSSQCNSSGSCSASTTWWKAVNCPVSPGSYSFPY